MQTGVKKGETRSSELKGKYNGNSFCFPFPNSTSIEGAKSRAGTVINRPCLCRQKIIVQGVFFTICGQLEIVRNFLERQAIFACGSRAWHLQLVCVYCTFRFRLNLGSAYASSIRRQPPSAIRQLSKGINHRALWKTHLHDFVGNLI